MPTPDRVRNDAKAADEQLRALATGQPSPAPTPAPAENDPPASLDDRFALNGEHPNSVPPNEDDPPEENPDVIDGKKYAQLQREHDALKGRLAARERETSELTGRLTQLERLVALRAEAAAAAPAPAPAAPVERPSLIKPTEVEEYGEEYIDLMRRVVREETSQTLTQLLDQIQRVGNRVGTLESATKNLDQHVTQS